MDNVPITLGLSGHDILLAQANAKPETTNQVPPITTLYEKADWDQLKQSMNDAQCET